MSLLRRCGSRLSFCEVELPAGTIFREHIHEALLPNFSFDLAFRAHVLLCICNDGRAAKLENVYVCVLDSVREMHCRSLAGFFQSMRPVEGAPFWRHAMEIRGQDAR